MTDEDSPAYVAVDLASTGFKPQLDRDGAPCAAQVLPAYVGVDLETTGVNPFVDRVVEFCLVQLDASLSELGRWSRRVNPGRPIPPGATAVHGIRDLDVATLPHFSCYAPRIQRLVQGFPIIAYNANFDVQLLGHELRRCGQPGLAVDHPRIDPYRIYREQVPDQYRLSGAVRHYLGRNHFAAHNASADIEATVEVLKVQWSTKSRIEASLP